jgi:hypothetical protein
MRACAPAALWHTRSTVLQSSEFTSARPRFIYGNWGTFVSNVKVGKGDDHHEH